MGGVPDMIEHGRTGLLSPAADIASLAANLRRVLDDPALALRLAAAARAEAAGRFHPRAVALRTRAVYQQVRPR